MIWELVFMLVILKIPVVYLCAVVWWAIKAEPPRPLEGAPVHAVLGDPPSCDWRRRRGSRRLGPTGGRRVRVAARRRAVSA